MKTRKAWHEVAFVAVTLSAFAICFEIELNEAEWISEMFLNDQPRMEAMIREIDGNEIFRSVDGSFLPACIWHGIECTAEGKISSIDWGYESIGVEGGQIFLEMLPPMIRKVYVRNMRLRGEIDTVLLPTNTQRVDLHGNLLTGTLDCTKFPAQLQEFDIHNNFIEGSINLSNLPSQLRILRLDNNHIQQDICYVSLPEAIQLIDLRENMIGATVSSKEIAFSDSRLHL